MISNRSTKISTSTSLETINRNSELVREHLLRQMRESLTIGKNLIGEELTGFSLVLKPVIYNLYSNLVQKDLEKGKRLLENQLARFAKKDVKPKGDWDTKFPEFSDEISGRDEEDIAKKREEYEKLLPVVE